MLCGSNGLQCRVGVSRDAVRHCRHFPNILLKQEQPVGKALRNGGLRRSGAHPFDVVVVLDQRLKHEEGDQDGADEKRSERDMTLATGETVDGIQYAQRCLAGTSTEQAWGTTEQRLSILQTCVESRIGCTGDSCAHVMQ
ncbi:hypothetical protein B1806_09550 [Metallibacterium scheffleri]|uniref:Uncharacterized protein n=1 Tax=Metallibacterium scheffleri TaxID=993689 RepID=A0A4S3KMF5_9GAMM|nr:hypothetical protein B1806_09550 [Metallibacterium scheffleri]